MVPVQVKESAGSESRERVYVSATDTHEMSGSKGTANFVSGTLLAPSAAAQPTTWRQQELHGAWLDACVTAQAAAALNTAWVVGTWPTAVTGLGGVRAGHEVCEGLAA